MVYSKHLETLIQPTLAFPEKIQLKKSPEKQWVWPSPPSPGVWSDLLANEKLSPPKINPFPSQLHRFSLLLNPRVPVCSHLLLFPVTHLSICTSETSSTQFKTILSAAQTLRTNLV